MSWLLFCCIFVRQPLLPVNGRRYSVLCYGDPHSCLITIGDWYSELSDVVGSSVFKVIK